MAILNIETKENSPEKLAAIAGKETKYFLMAEEFNDVVEAVNLLDSELANKVVKVNGYSLTKNDLTDSLKIYYDNAATWISTNATALINHLSRTDNPHNVTAAQVGAPSGSGTSTGTNTGDQDLTVFYTKTEVDGKISSVYKFKGNVANYASLPSTGLIIGDVYNLLDTGANYAWTGTVWDNLGTIVDVSGKEDVSNKTNTITGNEASTSFYASIKAIVDYFTVAKIKSILGITTLSGSNTGDETLASLKTKIETELAYACSDEVSSLVVGNVISFRAPFAMILSEIRISLNEAPTVSTLIVDVKESGVSIFSTLLSIDASELTSVTAAVPAVISDINLADDALLTVSITQIGSGNSGKGLKILFKGKKT
jgi:hypothetical protein